MVWCRSLLQQHNRKVFMSFLSFLIKLELAIITEVFERFSRWTQKLLGIDCFVLAWITAVISLFCSVILFVAGIIVLNPVAIIIAAIGIQIQIKLLLQIPETRKKCYDQLSKGYANREFADQGARRLLSLLIAAAFTWMVIAAELSNANKFPFLFRLIADLILLLSVGGDYLVTAFLSCTPLPPGPSKLRKVWESLKSKSILGDTEGKLAPVPI